MNTLNQEADMGYITDVVQKLANALVMSTQFPSQIEAMKADLASLHTDLETTKGRNAELDALLHDTRRQRDEAEQKLSEVKSALANLTHDFDKMVSETKDKQTLLDGMNQANEKLRAERDDYGMKQIEAEDRAKAAEAKLDKLREAMGLPKAEAKTTPEVNPYPTPAEMNQPEPGPSPTPPKRIYEHDYNYYEQSKGKPEHFDIERKQYYVEV